MTNDFEQNADGELRALFGGVTPPVPDDGFSHRVVKQVQASLWKRRAVLGAAAFVGLVLAAPAVTELMTYLSVQLQHLIVQVMASIKL